MLTCLCEAYSPLDATTVSINTSDLDVVVTFIGTSANKYVLATVLKGDACEGAVRKRMEGLRRVLEESLGRVESGV